jgi:hypothetical protein
MGGVSSRDPAEVVLASVDWRGRSACGAPSRPNSAYLLFVAAGSPALGEEGFAPAGSIFAAGVLAFAAAVPAVAFSPLGVDPVPPPPAPPAPPAPAPPAPPAANNDETGAAARASAKAKAHVLFSITLPPCAAHWRDDKASTPGEWFGGYHPPQVPSRSNHTGGWSLMSDGTGPYGSEESGRPVDPGGPRTATRNGNPDDPMGLRLAQVADELDAEVARQAGLIGRPGVGCS